MKKLSIEPQTLRDFVERNKDTRLVTVTCIEQGKFFELIYGFQKEKLVFLSVELPKKNAEIDSIMDIYPGAELYEREIHEGFNINFKGNPHQHSRLFLPENWPKDKHPMRKGGNNA